jgi:1-acyl-sn-glycerol-3-phosphate acyltransferase
MPTPANVNPVVRLWRGCYQWPAFYLVLVLLGTVQLAWGVVALVLRHVLPKDSAQRLGRRFISLLFRSLFRVTRAVGIMEVDADELDAIDADEALVIAPNHPSVMDALILISRLENLNCIMKASVLDNILLGSGARLAGYIRNDGPKRMLRLSSDHLKQGGQLIIFPEGTRTIVAPVNDFKCGFAAMARIANVPVQTVIIETDSPYLSKGWPALRKPKCLPMRFRARLGRRFVVEGGADINAFVAELRRYFVDELSDADLGELWHREREPVQDDRTAEQKPPSRGDLRSDPPTGLPSLTGSRWG